MFFYILNFNIVKKFPQKMQSHFLYLFFDPLQNIENLTWSGLNNDAAASGIETTKGASE